MKVTFQPVVLVELIARIIIAIKDRLNGHSCVCIVETVDLDGL